MLFKRFQNTSRLNFIHISESCSAKYTKDVAIAAGAIRFGQENSLFEPLNVTIKEIAEWFEVSTSSLNKYYNDLNVYYNSKK